MPRARRPRWCVRRWGARPGDVPDVILVVLDHPAAAGALLGAAWRLAELCGAARINALLVRTPPEAMVSPSEEVLTAQREAELRGAEADRANAVRSAFDAWTASAPPASTWHGSISTASSNCWSRNAAGAPTIWWSSSRRSTNMGRAGRHCVPPCSIPTGLSWWCRHSRPRSSAAASPLPGATMNGRPRRCCRRCIA